MAGQTVHWGHYKSVSALHLNEILVLHVVDRVEVLCFCTMLQNVTGQRNNGSWLRGLSTGGNFTSTRHCGLVRIAAVL